MAEAADIITTLTGGARVRYAPWPAEYSLVESGDYFADVSKSRQALTLGEPTPLVSGLARTVDLYREEHDQHLVLASLATQIVTAGQLR
jgi:hypothetical protein